MTSNFCKTSWHPYGHTPEECPDCQLCHESKIPKKLEFRPHLTTGVIARDRDMEMLVLWLNELRDYLQAKEEASKSSWHTFWSYSEKCVCCDKTLEELEKTEEASKVEDKLKNLISQVEKDAIEKTNKRWRERFDKVIGEYQTNKQDSWALIRNELRTEQRARLSDLLEDKK